ncbi:MAG: HEPN domain-containing protein, partial [Eubacterium sp.]|nr:HEPN domain-containing protein [Eubacterium sp.]
MALATYYDFAENDYMFFMASYNNDIVANMMGAMAQGICEKYMKHLIETYVDPSSYNEQEEKNGVMRTHSLNRLMKYLSKYLVFEFSPETKAAMRIIDGYYFSSRYPGDSSIELDKEDVENCYTAIIACKTEVDTYLNNR